MTPTQQTSVRLQGGPLDGVMHTLEQPFGLGLTPSEMWLPDPDTPGHLLHYAKNGNVFVFVPEA